MNSELVTDNHAKVLTCITVHKIYTANEIAEKIQISRTETYNIINSLQNMKLISSKLAKPTKFIAV